MDDKLNAYRKKIDEIDLEIRELFKKRFDCVKNIAIYKEKNNIDILSLQRENELIENLQKDIDDEDLRKVYCEFLKSLLTCSKEYQKIVIKKRKE